MAQMVITCASCGKRVTFPDQMAGTTLPCPFCGHLSDLRKPLQPLPLQPRNPGAPAAGSMMLQATGTKRFVAALAIGCCFIAGIGIVAGLKFMRGSRALEPALNENTYQVAEDEPFVPLPKVTTDVPLVAITDSQTIPKELLRPSAPAVMPASEPVNTETPSVSVKPWETAPVITEEPKPAGESVLEATSGGAGQACSTTEQKPMSVSPASTANNLRVAGPFPPDGPSATALLPKDPALVIVRANACAALPNGPWTIALPLGNDFSNYHCDFVDFNGKPVPTQVRQTGGTINKILELEYNMPLLGLTAKLMPSGIRIERSKEAVLANSIGSLLTFIRIGSADSADIIIWMRGLKIAGFAAKETESGLSVSMPQKSIPDAWRFVLNTNAIECHVLFKGMAKPEVCDFRITETPLDMVVELMMDENRRDAVWEAIQDGATPAGAAASSSGVVAPSDGGLTIASVAVILRFCEKGKPEEAMLVITTQP